MSTAAVRKIVIALITLLVVFVVFSAVVMIYTFPMLDGLFARADRPAHSFDIIYSDYEASYPRTNLDITSGKNRLNCYLYGANKTGGLVILCPGIDEGADSMLSEMMRFVNADYQVIAFDPTGVYDSEGDSTVGLTQEYLDLDAILDYVEAQKEFEDKSIYIYGVASGGYAAAAMLGSEHYITAAVSVSAYNSPLEITEEWTRGSLGLLSGRIAEPYILLYDFLKFGTKCNISAAKAISSCDTPILIAHGTNDATVSYNYSSVIAHESEITNPNVRLKSCDKIAQDGHDTLYLSRGSIEYRMRIDQEMRDLINQYGGTVPSDAAEAYYASIDHDRLNRLDDDFMGEVIRFFGSYHREVDLIKQLLDSYAAAQGSGVE